MSLSRKHFREIARILGQNFANDDLRYHTNVIEIDDSDKLIIQDF